MGSHMKHLQDPPKNHALVGDDLFGTISSFKRMGFDVKSTEESAWNSDTLLATNMQSAANL